jgi:hypothetical protein
LTQRSEHLWLLVHLSIKRKYAEGSHPLRPIAILPTDELIEQDGLFCREWPNAGISRHARKAPS